MDLEGFNEPISLTKQSLQNFGEVVEFIDHEWYTKASRSARWMDLLGDYAGSEPFIIDGDALFQIVLDDPLLSIGREDCSFQILHAYYLLERNLNEYQKRSANFQIVFWQENLHLSLLTRGQSRFVVASRALARAMLFRHLLKLPFGVHVFKDLNDPAWLKYVAENKPMFIKTNDGGLCGEDSVYLTAAILCQRVFLLQILSSSGIALALLKGTEYLDSKILTFVYEPSQIALPLVAHLRQVSRAANEKLHHTLSPDVQGPQYFLQVCDHSQSEVDIHSKFLQELDILAPIRKGTVPPAVVFIFIAHTLLVPTLGLHEMAQVCRPLSPQLTGIIRREFLPAVFSKAANVLGSHDYHFPINGTIFVALISFVLSIPGDVRAAIGSTLFSKTLSLWETIGGPEPDFQKFARQYSSPESPLTSVQHHESEPAQLLEFSNSLFDEEFSSLQVSNDSFEISSPKSGMYFEAGTILPDNRHWHSQKSLLPSHQGGSKPKPEDPRVRQKRLRSDQRFMATMQVQASSLTGVFGTILQQTVILAVGSGKKGKQPPARQKITATEKPLTSTEKLRLKIKEDKEAKQKDTSSSWWKSYIAQLSTNTLKQQIASINELRRPKSDSPEILLEMRLFRLHLELELWLNEPDRDSDRLRDQYTVTIMKMVQDICRNRALTPSAQRVLTNVLTALGFGDYVSQLVTGHAATHLEDKPFAFSFVKLFDSKAKSPRYPFMSITEHPVVWQLRLFGDYMDRSMDSSADRRVPFEPDAWQKKVLDGIDRKKSLLVVAPTSAGKTFISYYAMEKLLRESDDGILVYIAPTKALVTQIAAEVYARFSKNLNGKSCWAIHTRDYHIHNPQNCQILITVPDMLAIMLLSPPLAKTWTPRIKRIILDEVHSIGQQEGGAVWEQIILFAPCPIIGLSATIGSPGIFSDWLASVQKAHGFEYEFIEHHHRYSHLRKFFYHVNGKGQFSSLDKYKPTGRSTFLHPIGLLSFGPRALPPDLSLEAGDTLSLYNALISVQDQITVDIEYLEPKKFFSAVSGFLRQKDILKYESKLKEVLTELLKSSDPCDVSSPLGKVVHSLQDPSMTRNVGDITPSPAAFKTDLLVLLADLSVKNELPAILFNFNRTSCEIMARSIVIALEGSERKWRSENLQWNQKVKDWKLWKDQAKIRERIHDKLERQRKKADKDDRDQDSIEPAWQATFNPSDPNVEFCFVGRRSSLSRLDLEKHIAQLSWTSTPEWAFKALRRGIAVHHAGMNKHYRSLVESLFRQGFVQVVIATGTLALGINAPTKTVVFCGDSAYLTALMYRQCAGRAGRRGYDLRGNVVFYGIPADRVRRLVLSRIPTLGGNFPATATMVLRLFNLLDGSGHSDFAAKAIRSLISLPKIAFNFDIGRDQLLHHLRFSIEYLRRSGLIDKDGKPINLFVIASHLYYTEPSNLALVALMRHGILHTICNNSDIVIAKRELMILLCNLFGRKYLSSIFSKESNIERYTKKSPSMVVLPHLPETAENVLCLHEEEILRIFKGYAAAFSRQHQTTMGPDHILPLSGLRYTGSDEGATLPFRMHLSDNAVRPVVRSLFVANSGYGDSFRSVAELTTTARSGLNFNGHEIPSMAQFISNGKSVLEPEHRLLNAYILDFYIHGQDVALVRANGIRKGDLWYLLQDFMLTLLSIQTGVLQLLQTASTNSGPTTSAEEEVEISDLKTYDIDERSDGSDEDGEYLTELENVPPRDRNVVAVLSEICSEFSEKFRAMWA